MTPCDVIVAGLGAMGSAAAYQLSRRGRRVLGFDAFRPPHTHGSHHGESRIIRKAYYEHPAYVPLLERAFASWRELEEQSGQTLLIRTGGLMIGREDGELVRGVLESVRTHRLAHTVLSSAEIIARYPALRIPGDMTAVLESDAGILLPERCIAAFLDGAARAGAELRFDESVIEWHAAPGGVQVTTTRARYAAGALVLTAGAGMRDLLPELRSQLEVERQVVAHFRPAANSEQVALAHLPIFCLEQDDGRFYYGIPDLGRGCKIGRHHGGVTGAPFELSRDVSAEDIAELRGFLARHMPGANGELASSVVCLYTNTPDRHFVLDRHPRHQNVVIASVCSGHGFKFSTVVGEIVAGLLRGADAGFDLSLFRVDRFAAS